MGELHNPFEGVPSSALTARLYEIRRQERSLLVEFLHTLAEVERRRVHLDLAFPSLFAFLREHLGCSKAAAFRRSTAARLLVRFPEAEPYLADGRLCLTTFVDLRDVLEGRAVEVLDRASGKTEDEVKALVASYLPREAPADLLRRLPQPSSGPEIAPSAPAAASEPAALPTPSAAPAEYRARPTAVVEPISEELRVLRITVGREFVADLEAARAALSHQIPRGELAAVLHEGLRRVLRDHAKRRAAETDRPAAKPRVTDEDSRTIPAAVRRAVWKRDAGCCAYESQEGRVCRSTVKVQFHHIVPYARGGKATVENISLRCSVHNLHAALRDFGAERWA